MFKSVLIANRGEIAVRIARTLRKMGVRSVVAAAIPDRRSLAVRTADEFVLLEGYKAAETYLDIGNTERTWISIPASANRSSHPDVKRRRSKTLNGDCTTSNLNRRTSESSSVGS